MYTVWFEYESIRAWLACPANSVPDLQWNLYITAFSGSKTPKWRGQISKSNFARKEYLYGKRDYVMKCLL